MDDHYDQPIWPMVQGAANYAWNLIEEVLAMVLKAAIEPRACAAKSDAERARKAEREMQGVNRGVATADDARGAPKS
jgi:hypothetical protein